MDCRGPQPYIPQDEREWWVVNNDFAEDIFLNDPDPKVRARIADDEGSSRGALHDLASDPDPKVRAAVALNPQTSSEDICALTQDRNQEVRVSAFHHRRLTEEQRDILAHDRAWKVRREAAMVGGISEQSYVDLARDPRPEVARAIANNPNTPGSALDILSGHEDYWIRKDALSHQNTLPETIDHVWERGNVGDKEAVIRRCETSARLLTDLADHGDWLIRQATASHHNTPQDVVEELAEDDSENVRESAFRQLAWRLETGPKSVFREARSPRRGRSAKPYQPKNSTNNRAVATELLTLFRAVDIDDSVDLKDFLDFERAVMQLHRLIPDPPEGRKPILRLRKLGRERLGGAYYRATGTIVVDPRRIHAYAHEFGHYLDHSFGINRDLSSSPEFQAIANGYKDRFLLPPGQTGSKRKYLDPNYYRANAEIFARAFEIWCWKKTLPARSPLLPTLLWPLIDNLFPYYPFLYCDGLEQQVVAYFDRLVPVSHK